MKRIECKVTNTSSGQLDVDRLNDITEEIGKQGEIIGRRGCFVEGIILGAFTYHQAYLAAFTNKSELPDGLKNYNIDGRILRFGKHPILLLPMSETIEHINYVHACSAADECWRKVSFYFDSNDKYETDDHLKLLPTFMEDGEYIKNNSKEKVKEKK